MKKKVFKKWVIGVFALMIAIMQPTGELPIPSCLSTVVTAEASAASPGRVSLSSAKLISNNKIQINWRRTSRATHYRIYYKVSGGRWKHIKTVRSNVTSYTHRSSSRYPIRAGKKYIYTVRAYNSSSRKLGSYNSRGLAVTTLGKPQVSSWRKTHDSSTCNCRIPHDGVQYTISWKKVPGASGYQVFYGQNDNGKWYTHYKNTTKSQFSMGFSHVDTRIKAKVRAFRNVNGKRIYGPWSTMKLKSITYNSQGGSQNTSSSSGTGSVTFKSLRGKGFSYKNSEFSYGVGFGKNNNKVYIGVWNPSGTSSSYEDFLFQIKEGQYAYTVKGARSGYYYHINLQPYKNYVRVNIYCNNSSYNYFNILANFSYEKNAGFVNYAG